MALLIPSAGLVSATTDLLTPGGLVESETAEPVTLAVTQAEFSIVGQAVSGEQASPNTPASFSLSGQTIGLAYTAGWNLPVTTAEPTIAGQDIGLEVLRYVDHASFSIAPRSIVFKVTLTTTEAALEPTGQDITLSFTEDTLGSATLLIPGVGLVEASDYFLTPGGLIQSANAPASTYELTVESTAFSIVGQTVTFTPSGGVNVTMPVTAAAISLAGQSFLGQVFGEADQAEFSIVGQTITFSLTAVSPIALPVTAAQLLLTPQPILLPLRMPVVRASIIPQGQDIGSLTGPAALVVDSGDLLISGSDIGLPWVNSRWTKKRIGGKTWAVQVVPD